jgi:hemerythrin-like metal-binding protein
VSIFVWSKSLYGIGDEEIDAQHERLFKLGNELYDAYKQLKSREILARMFVQLLLYTQEHFKAEEALMERSGYPGLAEHREEHEKLVAELMQFIERYQTGKQDLSNEVMQFVKDWLLDHITERDRKIGDHLRAQRAG